MFLAIGEDYPLGVTVVNVLSDYLPLSSNFVPPALVAQLDACQTGEQVRGLE